MLDQNLYIGSKINGNLKGSLFFSTRSASGASCKDEAADKQRKKDDHNDGGSNDGANADKKSGTQLVLNACNNLYWFSSIFSFVDNSNLCFMFFF